MSECIINACKIGPKGPRQGLTTFHSFPLRNQAMRDAWIQIVRAANGDPDWVPSRSTVICSNHFDPNCIQTLKYGLYRVVNQAAPVRLLPGPAETINQPAEPPISGSLRTVRVNHIRLPMATFGPNESFCTTTPYTPPIVGEIKAEPQQLTSFDTSFIIDPSSVIVKTEDDPQHPSTESSSCEVKEEPPSLTENVEEDVQQQPVEGPLGTVFYLANPPSLTEAIEENVQQPPIEGPLRTVFYLAEPLPVPGPSLPTRVLEDPSVPLGVSISDTEYKLKKELERRMSYDAKRKRKIKALNRKVRRLVCRNQYLKDKLLPFTSKRKRKTKRTKKYGAGLSSISSNDPTLNNQDMEEMLPEVRAIILRVHRYLQQEYDQLKSLVDSSVNLDLLSNIEHRTAEATGVSERAVLAILDVIGSPTLTTDEEISETELSEDEDDEESEPDFDVETMKVEIEKHGSSVPQLSQSSSTAFADKDPLLHFQPSSSQAMTLSSDHRKQISSFTEVISPDDDILLSSHVTAGSGDHSLPSSLPDDVHNSDKYPNIATLAEVKIEPADDEYSHDKQCDPSEETQPRSKRRRLKSQVSDVEYQQSCSTNPVTSDSSQLADQDRIA